MMRVPFVDNLMFKRCQGIVQHSVGLIATIDPYIRNIHFISVGMGIGAACMVAPFGTTRNNEMHASFPGLVIQVIQERHGGAFEMNGICSGVHTPRGIHASGAAPLPQIALAEIPAIGVHIPA